MVHASDWWLTFLGTCSGGGPIESRNCSSLVANFLGRNELWMVDCAEGTLRQFASQPRQGQFLKVNDVSKIFITHLHADHVMGIVTFLRNRLFPPPLDRPAERLSNPAKIEIYGPAGIRQFVRANLVMTFSRTAENYIVHELLTDSDPITACNTSALHINELPGRDIRSTEDGFWRNVTTSEGFSGQVVVDVGPISHRDPCLGYIFRETTNPNRKVVILGDTDNPSTITGLCLEPSPNVLIHEATDAHIPKSVDPRAKRPLELIKERALARGHSIPEMAGTFAKSIGAQRLYLNHIGARFPVPRFSRSNLGNIHSNVIREIEDQASAAWGMGHAIAAYDYLTVVIRSELDGSGAIPTVSSIPQTSPNSFAAVEISKNAKNTYTHRRPYRGGREERK